MRIAGSGNVGIGTTSPLSPLSVAGGLAVGAYGGGASTTAAPSNGLIVSGNVGIGTTSPGTSLQVGTDLSMAYNWPAIGFNVNAGTGNYMTTNYGAEIIENYTSGYLEISSYASGTAGSGLGSGSQLVLSSGGNIGIGTTSPSYLLHVGSSSASGAVAGFQNSSELCTLTPHSSSPTWACSSDIRLKKDIVNSDSGLAWLGDMRVRAFTMRKSGERETGVVAQELQLTHPDMVHMAANGFYSVDSPNPWKLVKAIQELKADNDNLRAANDNLERRLQALEAARR
jgi:hypothetical protein